MNLLSRTRSVLHPPVPPTGPPAAGPTGRAGDETGEPRRTPHRFQVLASTNPPRPAVRWPLTHPLGPGLEAFAPPILAIRWGTLLVGLVLAVPGLAEGDPRIVAGGLILVLSTTLRTLRPIRDQGDAAGLVRVLVEVGLNAAVVIATGGWDSPFVLSLITAVTVAGFARGFAFALEIGLTSALAIAVPTIAAVARQEQNIAAVTRLSAQWTFVLVLVAAVAGYGRRIAAESAAQHSAALDRLGRMAEANDLLYALHRVAQTLPSSLDLDEVVSATMGRLGELFDADSTAMLVRSEADGRWQPLRATGLRLDAALADDELPPPLQRATRSPVAVSESNLLERGGPGLAPRAGSGLYAALRGRQGLIGLLALEHRTPQAFSARDLELLNGFVEPAALAIDNARWFSRLRQASVDQERSRIARDLHDRIGQSLAYLAFELDRITKSARNGKPVEADLAHLREDLRGVVGEVRETLYDLRTDVSEDEGVAAVLDAHLRRVQDRSALAVSFRVDERTRLPLTQEREIWRVAQEAVTNCERHARASALSVSWRSDDAGAELVVSDDGIGFPPATAGRLDSYGIVGMRERAASLGATLDLQSTPGAGTTVRLVLERSEPAHAPRRPL